MSEVRLTGQLICTDAHELAVVEEHLPDHIARTRAELGCLASSVDQTREPLIWQVSERFADPAAFATHQERVASNERGQATAGIERRYSVDGMPATDS
ncbi:putative quinol monooxygenase [Brevibacterium luteolum]|uniref:putative quinol monooxygenase n=1 Tax=Brevibacterium luteolum TaxID=199591 RepID=UPI00223BFD5C|nr:antibiotic biosynthesis monooxygenase [Brevibacterium luteolum]MCT1829127.1 antibiotic biosynthesis monooxygenase [Brevibacterium luteolum]MCT1921055.1 antibiotic biosynthesis monooxygenase [Brevibacterium luteolum]